MFAKLLKHEWRASRGILGVLSLAALGVGILGAVVLRSLIMNVSALEQETDQMLPVVLGIVLMFLIFALFAYALGSELILLHRFYKNKFTDEGYLTFTLPVTSKQIFLASFLNMAAWMLIISLVVSISVALMVLVGVFSTGYVDEQILRDFAWFYKDMFMEWGDVALAVVSMIVSFVYALVMAMTCVTLGAVIAKKHKILAAFGMYYALSMVSGVLQSVLTFSQAMSGAADTTGLYLGEIATQLVMLLAGFFLSTYLMEKKLNLP